MVVADRVDRDCRDECVALLVVKIYSWGQISDWRLEKDKDGGSYYLTIETRRRNEKSMCPGWKRAPLK